MKQGNRRNLLPKLIFVQVFVALALLAGALSSAASSGTTIAAGSASVPHGGQGTSTTIITRAAADASLNAYDITLSFDPAIVSVANVSPAAGWSLMPAPRINNAAGTVQVIAVRFDTCGLSCPAFSITWNGLAGGSSPLTLAGNADESLAGLGAYITSGFTSGTVTVSAPPTSTPTASPTSATPTATPSPSATPSPTVSPTATPIPSTPAPGAPAVIFGGSGGAPSGSTFTTTTRVNLAPPKDRPTSFDITLTFNPAVATVLSVVAGEGWSLAPQPVFDNATGTLHVSGLRFTPCGNYCPLFDTEWKAVAQGPTSLKLEGSADEVLGENGLNQPAVFTPGSIVVTPPQAAPESGGPKPAATPKKGNAPALPHAPGWNLLTWADEPMTPKEALSGSNPRSIEVIYVWDAAAGKWRRYAPNLPAYLSDLATIKSGDVIWLSSAK